jgi:hypothetical protein
MDIHPVQQDCSAGHVHVLYACMPATGPPACPEGRILELSCSDGQAPECNPCMLQNRGGYQVWTDDGPATKLTSNCSLLPGGGGGGMGTSTLAVGGTKPDFVQWLIKTSTHTSRHTCTCAHRRWRQGALHWVSAPAQPCKLPHTRTCGPQLPGVCQGADRRVLAGHTQPLRFRPHSLVSGG